jgi:hypothetical protein
MNKYMLFPALLLWSLGLQAQDSLKIRIYPDYDKVGKFHRFLFGENYRKEYAQETKVPVIRLSQIKGGLTPIKRGGGNQTHSLRLQKTSSKTICLHNNLSLHWWCLFLPLLREFHIARP